MQEQVSQETRVEGLLQSESRDIGRDCKLLDWAILAHDVIVIVYEPEAFSDAKLGTSREVRVATYIGTHRSRPRSCRRAGPSAPLERTTPAGGQPDGR